MFRCVCAYANWLLSGPAAAAPEIDPNNPDHSCRRAIHSSIYIILRHHWIILSASSAVTFLMAHVFFPTVSLLQMMLPRRTMRPKAHVSAHNHFLEAPCSILIFLRSDFATQFSTHACMGQEVPSSFMKSPSPGTPSMSSIDPSTDAVQASKRRGHLHTAEFANPHLIVTRVNHACPRPRASASARVLCDPRPLLIPRACREKWKPRSTPWIGGYEDWRHKN